MTVYFVATTGNDGGPGTTAAPWKTLEHAVANSGPGDTVKVAPGTYQLARTLRINKQGTADRPYVLEAQTATRPRIVAPAGIYAMVEMNGSYVTLNGIEIDGQDANNRGVTLSRGSHRMTLRNCKIRWVRDAAIRSFASTYALIENCEFDHCSSKNRDPRVTIEAETVLVGEGSHYAVIRGCTLTESYGGGLTFGGESEGIVVENNVVGNVSHNMIYAIHVKDCAIRNNLIFHDRDPNKPEFMHDQGHISPGISLLDEGGSGPGSNSGKYVSQGLHIYNNIVVNCGVGVNIGWASKKTPDRQPQPDGSAMNDHLIAHNTIVNCDIGIKLHAQSVGRARGTMSYIENNLVISERNDQQMTNDIAAHPKITWRNNGWSRAPESGAVRSPNDVISAFNNWLVNAGAPVVLGQVNADNYKLKANSPAIDRAHRNSVATDFFGKNRGNNPDIGAHEHGVGAVVPPGPRDTDRVTEGLAVLYEMRRVAGANVSVIRDTSGVGTPLDLTISDIGAVRWLENGLSIRKPVKIASNGPATKVIEACKKTNEITVEAWVRPAEAHQGGPARIVTVSNGPRERNFTLGQGRPGGRPDSLYDFRLRATEQANPTNGLPSVTSPRGTARMRLTHVVFTRDSNGRATLYVNGMAQADDDMPGTFENWDVSFPLVLANETGEKRPWFGEFYLVAVFDRALSLEEVRRNYGVRPEVAVLEFELTMPEEYRRFVLVKPEGEAGAKVVAYGVQFPDSRVVLAWDDAPYHIAYHENIGQVRTAYLSSGEMEMNWVDGEPEEATTETFFAAEPALP